MPDRAPLRDLGELFFYSIPQAVEVSPSQLHELAQQCNLPGLWLPKSPTALFAFKRAAQLLGAQRVSRVLGAGKEQTLLQSMVYVRDSPRKHHLRHIVKEIRRGGDKPEYLILGSVECRDDILRFTCETEEPTHLRDYDAMRKALQTRFDACLGSHSNKDLQRLASRALRHMLALPLRSSGGVFFIPACNRGQLRSLVRLIDQLGGTSDTYPVHNTPLQAEHLARNVHHTLQHEVEVIESRIHEMQLQGYLPACRIRGFQSNLAWCREVQTTYAAMLAADLQPAQAVLQQAEQMVAGVA